MATPAPKKFVSRAGGKLEHALDAFTFDVTDLECADFGCNVGGFTDCLLQRGAASVVAIDTGHNVLAWKLRADPRVTVKERTNALHTPPPPPSEAVDLVVLDMAWTRLQLAIPAALRWLRPAPASANAARPHILTLVKPHYELEPAEKDELLVEGRLDHEVAETVSQRTLDALAERLCVRIRGHIRSPMTGGKSSKKHGKGNVEFLALLEPAEPDSATA
ncbi:MAG: SAM-dependent methyltransferase [Phycisphaerales bacterium]